MSFYRQQLENWLKTLPVKAETVFDIGGAQGHVKERTLSWDVQNYDVLDLPAFDLEQRLPIGTSRFHRDKVHNAADIIFCLEVFEYLINPIQAMENIEHMLKPGGIAYVTFAFVYPHHNELESDSLRYTEPGIARLADTTNLVVTNTWYRVDGSGYLEQFYKFDGMRAAKQYTHHDATGFIVELRKPFQEQNR